MIAVGNVTARRRTVGRWEWEGTIPRSAVVRANVAELLGVDPWVEDDPEAGS